MWCRVCFCVSFDCVPPGVNSSQTIAAYLYSHLGRLDMLQGKGKTQTEKMNDRLFERLILTLLPISAPNRTWLALPHFPFLLLIAFATCPHSLCNGPHRLCNWSHITWATWEKLWFWQSCQNLTLTQLKATRVEVRHSSHYEPPPRHPTHKKCLTILY